MSRLNGRTTSLESFAANSHTIDRVSPPASSRDQPVHTPVRRSCHTEPQINYSQIVHAAARNMVEGLYIGWPRGDVGGATLSVA